MMDDLRAKIAELRRLDVERSPGSFYVVPPLGERHLHGVACPSIIYAGTKAANRSVAHCYGVNFSNEQYLAAAANLAPLLAAEAERLAAENERLRAALRPFAEFYAQKRSAPTVEECQRAVELLEGKP